MRLSAPPEGSTQEVGDRNWELLFLTAASPEALGFLLPSHARNLQGALRSLS